MQLKLIIGLCLFSVSLWAYPSLQKIEELLPYTVGANEQTLVVFDIDYTLTMPSEPAFHMAGFKQYKSSIKEWIKPLTDEEKFWLAPYTIIYGHSILIEKETPDLIKALQKNGIKSMALTACPSGNLQSIGNIAEWRSRQLKAMGIDFEMSFPTITSLVMSSFKEQFGSYPGFYKGILYSNSSPFIKISGLATKGDVLRQFLEQIQWKPQRIIFIDDDLQNLDSVALTMQEWGIAYTGLHYVGAQASAVPSLTEEDIQQAWMRLIKQLQAEPSFSIHAEKVEN